jgi:hypothetical protein
MAAAGCRDRQQGAVMQRRARVTDGAMGRRRARSRLALATVVAVGVSVLVPGLPAAADGEADVIAEGRAREGSSLSDRDLGSQAREEALAEAASTGAPVEVVVERAESIEVWALPSGGVETREFVVPRWTRGPDGWVRVDTNLEVTAEGVSPVASTSDVVFSGGGNVDPLVTISRHGRTMSWSWPGSLPDPVLDGDAAIYPEVLEGVDLRLLATESGFVTHVVVKTPEAAALPELDEITFDMATDGIDVSVTGDGGLEATDQTSGGVVFAAPPASMWSAPDPAAAGEETAARTTAADGTSADVGIASAPGEGEPAAVAPVAVAVPAGGDAVTLVPDQQMLDDPETNFPVVIDPFWDTVNRSAWSSPNRSWPTKSYWKFDGKSDQGVGTCAGWDNCSDGSTYRLFYQFDISQFKGKSIGTAVVSVTNTHSAQCTAHPVDLWHTGRITSSTTWSNQPAFNKLVVSRSFAYGGNQDPCQSQAKGEFPVRDLIQEGADKGWNRVTIALRVDESDKNHWKKFSRDAALRVTANEAPNSVPRSALSLKYGGACTDTSAEEPVRIRSAEGNILRVAAGAATDPDPEAKVRVHFRLEKYDGTQVWEGWTDWKAEGSYFAIGMPANRVPDNDWMRWSVRVQDQELDGFGVASSSAWSSPTCTFTVDTRVPAPPEIVSRDGEYPQPDPADPQDMPHGGAGNYGYFDISSSSPDVARFEVWFNNDRSTVVAKTGNPVSVRYMPLDDGEHTIQAAVFDTSGNKATAEYVFHVAKGADPVGSWTFDDPVDGEPAPTGYGLRGDASVATGLANPARRAALSLDGNGDYAVAAAGAGRVDTTKHFSVQAWVRPDALTDLGRMSFVVSEPGQAQQGFRLYWGGAWSFAIDHEDQATRPVRERAWCGTTRRSGWVDGPICWGCTTTSRTR